MLLETLRQQAINNQTKKRILFPEVMDKRILEAAIQIANEGIAIPVLVGYQERLDSTLSENNLTLPSSVESIDSSSLEAQEPYAQKYFEMRQHKGVTIEQSRFTLHNPVYFAMMMLQEGRADGLVSGANSSATKPLTPAFQIIKTQPEITKVSSFFLMIPPSTPEFQSLNSAFFVFADCAINIDPTSEDLAEIAILTHDSAKKLGIEPKLAMLSFSTYGSAKHANVDKVRITREMVNEKRPDIVIGGEMQFDAATIPWIANSKCSQSPIQGDANVLIFPDLQSGNIAYKITERLAGYRAIGPIMQGLNKPVNDLSRGCSVEDIIDVATISSLS